MSARVSLSSVTTASDLAGFLEHLRGVDAWTAHLGRAWDFPQGPAGAVLRSLGGLVASRGEGVPAAAGDEAPISSAADSVPAAQRLAERARAFCPELSQSLLRGLRYAAEELTVNIVDHAQAGRTGFASMIREGPGVLLWVSDCGVGIEGSLRKNPEFGGRISGDAEAIALAVEQGVTCEGGRRNKGIGLRLVSDFAQTARGELVIVSGEAKWRRTALPSGAAPAIVERVAPWRGTIVALWIPVSATVARRA